VAYNPITDFLALIRRTSNGARVAEVPGLDYVLAALARAGLFAISVGQTAPTSNQASTVWLQPALQSWTAEGVIYLWNADTATYEPATPALWTALFAAQSTFVIQEITLAGPVNVQTDARIVLVNQAVSAPITLIMPEAVDKTGDVLISDWKADSGLGNVITMQRSGADVFPGAATSWQIAGNGASLLFRPMPGRGYAL
jgi:hypothetical protein